MTTRREFLQTGLAGSLLLGAAGCTRSTSMDGRSTVLLALIPVLLAGALPGDPENRQQKIQRTLSGVEKAIAGLSPATQEEIAQLFDLLAFPLSRILVAGVWPRWEEATPEQLAAFLESWRHSRFDLLRSGYAALHDLILGAWYARPDTWEAIGYPGPPRIE